MSLELAITDLAAAMRELAAATRGAPLGVVLAADQPAPQAGTPAAESPAADKPRRGRPPKVEGKPTLALNPGDPEGTTYWHHVKSDTAYAMAPGDTTALPEGAYQIDGPFFLAKKAEIAAKYPESAKPAAASGPVAPAHSPPTATAAVAGAASTKVLDYATVRAALLQVAKDDPAAGRDKVLAVLAAVKVNAVPELATASAELLAAVMAQLSAPAAAAESDALFG